MPKNLLELPGLVDVHTHLREPGGIQKEDFQTGTKAAVAGGFTQILDMPNNIPPTVSKKALEDKIKLAEGRIYCDVGFNFGATRDSVPFFSKVTDKVFGLKLYMSKTTGDLIVTEKDDQELIFQSWQSPLPIMIHARGELVENAIDLAKKYGKPIHVCHLTFDQVESIKKARKAGVKVTCEVCPHHLFLSNDDLKRLGSFGIMKPPLMSKKGQQGLWENIGIVDVIATDHAPHTKEEKEDQSSPKFGVPGLETALPLMLLAVSQKKLSFQRLIEMMSENPRKIFKIPDQEKTYILVDLSEEYEINNKNLFTKSRWSPFEGTKVRGKVEKVVLRGITIFEKGKFLDHQGKIMRPLFNNQTL